MTTHSSHFSFPHKHLLALVLSALTPFAAYAAGPVAPGAGSLLQQIQPAGAPAPSSTDTGLQIAPANGTMTAPSAPFPVKSIRITGNTAFASPILHALVADGEGKDLTLTQLNALAARITDYYHQHGYPLARAIIPAQTIQNGLVTIEIIEARFGQVSLHNSSRVEDGLLTDTLAPLTAGSLITQSAMDRSLLLLSDIPGVAVNATLKPGSTVGSSDLLVDTTPTPSLNGNVALDNYGNRYTGRVRAGGTVNIIDPLHHGDVLSLSGLTSGQGMNYGDLSYESLLNGEGTRLGGGYSALHYVLGGPLSNLDGNGTAEVASVWAKQPLLRGTEVNVYSKVEFDHLQLQDNLNNGAIETARHLDNATASLSGDSRDQWLSGGIYTWSLAGTAGRLGFDNGAARLADAASTKTQGGFTKWNLNVSRLQTLSENNGLYLSFSGQWADTNLDPSQQMIAGGPYSVRGYDMAVLSGDNGYLATVELRHQLGRYWQGQWQAIAFVDNEHLTINNNAFAPGVNGATLSGAGLGLNWAGPYQLAASTYVAAPFGSTPALVGTTKSVQGWVQVSKGF